MTTAPFHLKAPEALITEYAKQFDAKVMREEIRPEYPVPVKIIETMHCEGCGCHQVIKPTGRGGTYES